eukprot:1263163-Pyramimonas_sp.AAC.1
MNPYLDIFSGETDRVPQNATCFENASTMPQAVPRATISNSDRLRDALFDSDDEGDSLNEGESPVAEQTSAVISTACPLPNIESLSLPQGPAPVVLTNRVLSTEQDGKAGDDRLREGISEPNTPSDHELS